MNPVFGGKRKVKFEIMTSLVLAKSISFRVNLNPKQSKRFNLFSAANSYSSRYQSPRNCDSSTPSIGAGQAFASALKGKISGDVNPVVPVTKAARAKVKTADQFEGISVS